MPYVDGTPNEETLSAAPKNQTAATKGDNEKRCIVLCMFAEKLTVINSHTDRWGVIFVFEESGFRLACLVQYTRPLPGSRAIYAKANISS